MELVHTNSNPKKINEAKERRTMEVAEIKTILFEQLRLLGFVGNVDCGIGSFEDYTVQFIVIFVAMIVLIFVGRLYNIDDK